MTARLFGIATIGVLVAVGCAHTKTTDDGAEKKAAEKSETSETKPAKPRAATGARGSSAADGGDRDGIPLATAPGGLLAPGAEQKIRERLVAEGCLADGAKRSGGALSEGLRRCQSAHDLPATGMPDDATIKALGLEPGHIFRHGPVKD